MLKATILGALVIASAVNDVGPARCEIDGSRHGLVANVSGPIGVLRLCEYGRASEGFSKPLLCRNIAPGSSGIHVFRPHESSVVVTLEGWPIGKTPKVDPAIVWCHRVIEKAGLSQPIASLIGVVLSAVIGSLSALLFLLFQRWDAGRQNLLAWKLEAKAYLEENPRGTGGKIVWPGSASKSGPVKLILELVKNLNDEIGIIIGQNNVNLFSELPDITRDRLMSILKKMLD